MCSRVGANERCPNECNTGNDGEQGENYANYSSSSKMKQSSLVSMHDAFPTPN